MTKTERLVRNELAQRLELVASGIRDGRIGYEGLTVLIEAIPDRFMPTLLKTRYYRMREKVESNGTLT